MANVVTVGFRRTWRKATRSLWQDHLLQQQMPPNPPTAVISTDACGDCHLNWGRKRSERESSCSQQQVSQLAVNVTESRTRAAGSSSNIAASWTQVGEGPTHSHERQPAPYKPLVRFAPAAIYAADSAWSELERALLAQETLFQSRGAPASVVKARSPNRFPTQGFGEDVHTPPPPAPLRGWQEGAGSMSSASSPLDGGSDEPPPVDSATLLRSYPFFLEPPVRDAAADQLVGVFSHCGSAEAWRRHQSSGTVGGLANASG